MKKIGVIGATGTAGTKIFKEAEERGHEVAAIVRNGEKANKLLGKDINLIEEDAFDLTKGDLIDFDVVVNAFGTEPETAQLHVDLARLLSGLFNEDQENSPRFFFILGAGSLLDENDELFVETIRQAPNSEEFISVPEKQLKELNYLREEDELNWVGISPSAEFKEGEATEFKLGKNHILQNDKGESVTTSGTLAKAILDEIEDPQFEQERFTVVNN